MQKICKGLCLYVGLLGLMASLLIAGCTEGAGSGSGGVALDDQAELPEGHYYTEDGFFSFYATGDVLLEFPEHMEYLLGGRENLSTYSALFVAGNKQVDYQTAEELQLSDEQGTFVKLPCTASEEQVILTLEDGRQVVFARNPNG